MTSGSGKTSAVVCIEAFKAARGGVPVPQSVECPLCDTPTAGISLGDTVAYVCGGFGAHGRLRWEHGRDQVA